MNIEIEWQKKLAAAIVPQGRLREIRPLQGGMSAGMTVLEIVTPAGKVRRLIVRQPGAAALMQNPHAAADEFRLLQMLHAQGIAVPEPVFLDAVGEICPASCLVLAYIDAVPQFASANPSDTAIQMAEQLARMHRLDLCKQDFSFLTERQGCAEAQPVFHAGARRALETDAAVRAIQTLPKRPSRTALLHGDFWPGNVLWHANRIAGVIDWEDAHTGDPLSDLAISRLDIACIYGWDAMLALTEQYLVRMAADDSGLPYWDLCAALRLSRLVGADLAGWAAYFHPFGREDITGETIHDCFVAFVEQALDRAGSRRQP